MITPTVLNPVQLHLLQMFQYATEERELNDLKSVLRDYYKKKLDDATDKMWQEGELNDNVINEMLNSHHRTPYK